MASHLSSLGFNVTCREDFTAYGYQTCEKGEKITTNIGTYFKWEIGNGIEFWAQKDVDDTPLSLNPYFDGNSQIKIRIESKIKRPKGTKLDGAFYCWADPDENGKGGTYPFVFDSPNIETYNIKMPQVVMAQITGIAHELYYYSNEDDFDKSQGLPPKFASKSFMPIGLFDSKGRATKPPEALAMLTGHVLDTYKIINPLTDLEIIYAKVSTFGGEYDIIVDSQIVEDEICIGGIITGNFWLTGKIIGDYLEKESKEGFSLRRLFKIK